MNQTVDLRKVKAAAKTQFGDLPGIQGVGIGDGTVRVYVRNSEDGSQLPDELEGVPLEKVVTGDIAAQSGAL